MHFSAPPAAPAKQRALYWRLWAAFPRDIGYLALTGVLVVIAAALYGIVGNILTSFGGGLAAFVAFAVLLVAGLYFGRLFGTIELTRLGWAREPAPRPVVWRRKTSANRFVRFVEVAADPHYWLYFAFTVVVFPWVGFLVVAVTVAVASTALGGVFGSIALAVLTSNGATYGIPGGIWQYLFNDHAAMTSTAAVVVALIAAALLPFITRGAVLVQGAIAGWMLGGFRSEQLQAEVAGLEVSRSAAVSAEGTALRRLERDIHDGPQQRLIRMQMDLSAASRAVETDPEKSRRLIVEAQQQAKEALEELRALSRGFAPPLLLDRGLAPALDAVVDRATVPTRFTDELPEGLEIPVETERNAYFIAAELLTNVGKHSGAGRAELILSAPKTIAGDELRVVVTDDGRGGATARPGHGLAGIEQRLMGLGGRLELRSPEGGPTHASVHLPLAAPDGSTARGPEARAETAAATPNPTLPYPTEDLSVGGGGVPAPESAKPRTTEDEAARTDGDS
ncbi:signal transduction histidine kinase [Frondihabitans sp. PhB188]|nr:signal transduction histidine kinase [Frondihabitans sp. PhB188]